MQSLNGMSPESVNWRDALTYPCGVKEDTKYLGVYF